MLRVEHLENGQLQCTSESEADTVDFGQRLAQALRPGDIVALVGDLGAGKTRLVQALATALGVPADEVNSPTFTLVQEYSGRIPLRHCDTYRLRHPDEFLDLGLDELFDRDGIALIEWADRVTHLLPRDLLTIRIEIISLTGRRFHVSSSGNGSRETCQRLASH